MRDDATYVRMFSSGSHKTLTGPTFAQIYFLTEATHRFSKGKKQKLKDFWSPTDPLVFILILSHPSNTALTQPEV